MAKPIVAVVGRPNVGKSTLFNKLVGERIAIVEDTPGVTRDRIIADAEWQNHHFTLIDTGGIEPHTKDDILLQMRVQAELAIDMADLIVLLVDGREGMTASDHVKALLDHSGPGLVDLCLCNSAPVRPGLVERYREEDAAPIVVDRAAIEALGVEAVTRPLASETLNYARHSFARLAEAVMELYNERADTKIF